MEPITTTLAASAIAEGVKFLYNQADQVLRSWRERRRNKDAAPPKLLPAPEGVVVVAKGEPVAEPPDRDTEDTLRDLLEALEPVVAGEVPAAADEAREAAGTLRGYLEQLMRASITFEGEPPRTLDVRDVSIVAKQVSKDVIGVTASLERLGAQTKIEKVRVQADSMEGDVIGVDLT